MVLSPIKFTKAVRGIIFWSKILGRSPDQKALRAKALRASSQRKSGWAEGSLIQVDLLYMTV